jgi:hypothetical protein
MGRGKSKDASGFWERYGQLTSKDLPVSIATGIPRTTLSSAREAKRFLRGDETVAVARFFGKTAEFMIDGDEGNDAWISENHDLLNDLRILPSDKLADQKEAIHAIAEKVRRELGKFSDSGSTGS